MPPLIPPMRRSRNGCIDCRRAKVKCDEIRPSCGTCARRRHVCQGYKQQTTHSRSSTAALTPAAVGSKSDNKATNEVQTVSRQVVKPPASESSVNKLSTVATTGPSESQPPTHLIGSPRVFSFIPPGTVPLADEPHIEVYFNRHPFELLIGPEFVNEMNANVLLMLQQDPVTVADAISAVGYSYLVGDSTGSLLPVLNRRARILANLRSMKPSRFYFEEALFLLLGLCAMELVTLAQPGHHATIPTVLSNVASLISHHISTGGEVSSVAKYYLRALARQDLVVSLVQLRRPRVPAYVWLETESPKPDRLLGYTITMMPLLEELCILAEEVRDQILQPACSNTLMDGGVHVEAADDSSPSSICVGGWINDGYSDLSLRAESLRIRLESWRPVISDNVSFRTSRKFRAQAACYRAGALLYLHRLFHIPNSSVETDKEALSKAHDVMLYTSGPPAETKMLLWPVFLAACEMSDIEDRAAVLEVFGSMGAQRKTVTVERTQKFVEQRVWKARDEGQDWNWMTLAQTYPEECLPI
ncbi:uncharacterized protein CTRU02_202605 [Colletotrichum truncatum]|uniref:Uncharacterized protein n=1 Tax=Colletotrichum truncatum TaxID=5467 RepID=A0ACC3ZL64_COLTU|nr:uncharacterized protein CTRU02_01774 [Colletotrichum truncatum]KAF6800095.1 hypothetical protein CTRU02_01774 [Colletotrichum truncatum]